MVAARSPVNERIFEPVRGNVSGDASRPRHATGSSSLSVLLPANRVDRIAAVQPGSSLAPLADALSAELEPLVRAATLPIPHSKARLTRHGGRCPTDGMPLRFDPWAPHHHACPQCGRVLVGEDHDAWWAMGAQLWIVERAVHAAALYAVRGDDRHARLASRILRELSERYLSWPNRDNVLGPSRPFFSTYLESIWLLNACHALALLEAAHGVRDATLATQVRDTLIAPSVALIAAFNEGLSNRQVWNEVAILSAHTLLGNESVLQARLRGPRALPQLATRGLLSDGGWYEGENYHLFAHRGLWYGAQLLTARGEPFDAVTVARYHAGFVTPFLGVLPDGTLPARRDAKYGVSLRNWRIAEWCELGHAATDDARLAGVLAMMYTADPSVTHGDTERSRSTADAERTEPASRLSRASLSWRALLMASPAPVPSAQWVPESRCLPEQGLAVLRREQGRVYVALEGGQEGGGHGHPDALALTLQRGASRVLDDPGTGSYVERTLHWYRSTLAHHAPFVNGASQQPARTSLLAFEDRGGAGWVRKAFTDQASGVQFERTVVVCGGYAVDVLEWTHAATGTHDLPTVTLPIAGAASCLPVADWQPAERPGAGGREDGCDFVEHLVATPMSPQLQLNVEAFPTTAEAAADTVARCWYAVSAPALLLRGRVPGPPGHAPRDRHWIETTAASGRMVGVWTWASADAAEFPVGNVHLDAIGDVSAQVVTQDGTIASHAAALHGWHIDLHVRHARSSIDLEGIVRAANDAARSPAHGDDETCGAIAGTNEAVTEEPHAPLVVPLLNDAVERGEPGSPMTGSLTLSLSEPHYVPTEQSWAEAGAPVAQVAIGATSTRFVVDIIAQTGTITVPADRENPLDNEHGDVNADGVQWYLALSVAAWSAAGLWVPAAGRAGRETRLEPGNWPSPAVRWCRRDNGWAARFCWFRTAIPTDRNGVVRFDLVVNERPPERERRRGQLVASGGGGFGYLQGDRRDPAHAVRLQLPPHGKDEPATLR